MLGNQQADSAFGTSESRSTRFRVNHQRDVDRVGTDHLLAGARFEAFRQLR